MVCRPAAISSRAERSTASTARLKVSSLAFDGRLKPESLRTNCSDEAWISSAVAGGLKFGVFFKAMLCVCPPLQAVGTD